MSPESGNDELAMQRTRREMARLAAAGFVAAASGLLLPAVVSEQVIPEAEAGNATRRLKRRLRRARRRARGGDAPQAGNEGIAFAIESLIDVTVELEFWWMDRFRDSLFEWHRQTQQTLRPGRSTSDSTSRRDAILWIDQHRFVTAFNPIIGFPALAMGYGGPMSRSGWSGTVVLDQSVQVGDQFTRDVDGLTISVRRRDDSLLHKNFTIQIIG